MQKICAIILLFALASNYEALPQTKWSRPVRNPQGQLTRERRQFPFGDWIPLSQPCPTCRHFADPLDAGVRGGNIGLTPPRPPTVTRQIHGEGNFFPQDESSILSVPPPPPSAIPRHPSNGNFQFSSFGQQFNNPLPVPQQQIQFLPQPFLQNQQLLVNGNQQILPGLNSQNNLFGQNQQQINNGKVAGFNSEFKTQKLTENIVLEQNRGAPKQAFSNKAQPFTQPQQNQQKFVQQQSFGGQQQGFGGQQHAFGAQQQVFGGQQQGFGGQQQFGNSILTPPPAPKNFSQDVVIPGLDKEEIQLLYVPVETLRQKGTTQEQLLTQQPQNIQFFNRGNGFKRPVNIQPTEQTLTQPKGHFVTQNGNSQGQSDNNIKVTSSQTFPPSVTPSTVFLQHLPFQQTPQPFVSATPATPTSDPFVTPASVFQNSFTPGSTLSHLSTVPNTIQFSQSDIEFGTTPKPVTTQSDIVNGKSQFSGLKNTGFSHEQGRPFQQQFPNEQQTVTQQPHLTTIFNQEQQREVLTPTHFPQVDQQQIALQKQQEHQRLLQQQRQNELEEQRLRKQKELEEQRALQLKQQQHQKELEEQRILQQQQRQKELEQQRYLQKQKELEEQRIQQQQQRQKELEQQRYLQKQKELEEQRLLQQRQKELEQQRFLQKQKELEEQRLLQQRQKELEEQRYLQEQRQKELENQRRQQLQQQKELEEKRRLQLKQKEEEQRLRVQQQQKELEQQRLLQQQQEQQRQKQENYKKFQIFKQQYHQQQQQQQLQQQQQQQQQQQLQQQQPQQQSFQQQQVFQQTNRHVLPANDQLNFIPQIEKEAEAEDQLIPHQPPLSVFFKQTNGADSRITDVLRELRSSNTITVLDQYFDKMPKVFVGPAGLAPPVGYEKFELPYLSNIESNRIERRIGKLPFFVAPLNFVPPPGYAKIPFPAPHVGSVVVSSEANPSMTLKSLEKGSAEVDNVSGVFPVVGPELPGLINNLDTETTTLKPTTHVSTPSLPQTTAQLRNRRPNNSLYKPQTRKPITRTRPTTTSKPEEDVTQPIQQTTESGVRKPFNRFLNRRRQQTKTTTEAPSKSQQDGKNTENRLYSGEVRQKGRHQFQRTQPKNDVIGSQNGGTQFNQQYEHSSIDRITPSGHGVFEVRPTPDFSKISQTEGSHPDYADVSLQTFEDGPLPTGSAKTITQELYRPNAVSEEESKSDSTSSSVKYPASGFEDVSTGKLSEVSPTVGLGVYKDTVSEGQISVEPTSILGYEKQDGSSERYDSTEASRTKISFTTGPTGSGEQQTKSFLDSNEQYTSAFAEISKPHHIPGFVDSSQHKFSNVYPTPEISVDLQAPHEHDSGEVKPTQNSAGISNKYPPTASSNEQYSTGFEGIANNQNVPSSQVSPTVSNAEQYTTGFSEQAHNSGESNRRPGDERIGSFINVQDVHSTAESPVSPHQYSTAFPSQATATGSNRNSEYPVYIHQSQVSPTAETVAEVTVNPSVQTYTTGPEGLSHVNEETSEGHGQDVADNLSNDHRLKLPNPSIVRVRTRVRGKSRGQVNFAASQTTTPASFTRSRGENKQNENAEHEITTKVNSFRDYNPIKTSKFNQYRGIKKPVRTTTEPTAEYEQTTANIYTVRPPRRPFNPSTVSTKRIRRPTTPIPSSESATEAFGISTVGSNSENSDISPSGVSNDVYFEQSSLSPVKHKFRKHFGTAEQKNDVVPVYVSTAFPTTTYSASFPQEEYSEESNIVKEASHTEASLDISEKYPEWNPSESGFDVSGIVLTTARTTDQEEQPELEEPKKSQDSKKAFDPDLEKKTGRRRIRVRVHKRPHENFETAESQNLRTVANVLVPPTTTYKPNDESNFHQLAKNTDFSFGGQKLFGSRSREYFRKRLNLTSTDGEQSTGATGHGAESSEKTTESKTFIKKAEKTQNNDFESVSNHSSETTEGSKVGRPKFRGFVRKIVKHGGATKEVDSESNQVPEHEESGDKHETTEYHTRQTFRGGFNHTGRVNGTRHKTFVRYVKKNKVRQHETETVQETSSQEPQNKDEQGFHQTTETHTAAPVSQETSNVEAETTEVQDEKEEGTSENQSPVTTTQQQLQTTEETESKETQQPIIQTTQETELEVQENSSQETSSNTPAPATPQTHLTGLYLTGLTQRPKFYQTLRPVFQRPTLSGFQRSKETESTPAGFQRHRETESTSSGFHRNREPESGFQRHRESGSSHTGFHRNRETESTTAAQEEKRTGYTRYKYGKPTGFGSTGIEKLDEAKKQNEQLKNKNQHTLEVRKYLRTKNREGAFSQFSKNKYFTSERTETTTDEESGERGSEEITTERNIRTSPSLAKITEALLTSTEIDNETTENDEEAELRLSTTETIASSEEESSEDEITSSVKVETTTETELPTTIFHTTSGETSEKATEPKTQTTEAVEDQRTEYEPDIYRFSKHSFSFDESEKFTGTKNRAHVRNITADIIENTASFSAPGVEKRPEIHSEELTTGTESHSDVTENEKTEVETTELNRLETTTENQETETIPSTDAVTKAKIAKVLKTSTTTKVSHETEICYRGKCIRTKSENPDDDLKLLVDSASTMKIEKTKT